VFVEFEYKQVNGGRGCFGRGIEVRWMVLVEQFLRVSDRSILHFLIPN